MITTLIFVLLAYGAVPNVDLDRYSGTWHEIARLPNRFQKDCAGDVSAQYTLRTDGKIDVLNRCRKEDGRYIQARGVARKVGKGKPNSVLKVRFAPAFLSFLPQVWGDYQILSLAADYSYAAVGSPNLKYLWILSRSPQMTAATYQRIVEEMRSQGFDVDRLVRDPATHSDTE